MNQITPMIDNSGTEYDIPKNELKEFQTDMGTDAQRQYLYRTEDGTDYAIPESESKDFLADFPNAQPVRRFQFADGSTEDVPANELKSFFSRYETEDRYKADREIRDMRRDAQQAKIKADAELENLKADSPVWAGVKEFFTSVGRYLWNPAEEYRNQFGDDNTSTQMFTYGNDSANAIAAGVLKIPSGLEKTMGFALGGRGNAVGNFFINDAQGYEAAVDRNLPQNEKARFENGDAELANKVQNMTSTLFNFTLAGGVGAAGAPTIVAIDSTDQYIDNYDRAIARGAKPEEANAIATEAFMWNAILEGTLINGGIKPMYKGAQKLAATPTIDLTKQTFSGITRGLTVGTLRNFAAQTTGHVLSTGAIMGTDAMGKELLRQDAEGEERNWTKVWESGKGGGEEGMLMGLMFGSASGMTAASEFRAYHRAMKKAFGEMAVKNVNTPQGREMLARTNPKGTYDFLKAREDGGTPSRKQADRMILPDDLSAAERAEIADKFLKDGITPESIKAEMEAKRPGPKPGDIEAEVVEPQKPALPGPETGAEPPAEAPKPPETPESGAVGTVGASEVARVGETTPAAGKPPEAVLERPTEGAAVVGAEKPAPEPPKSAEVKPVEPPEGSVAEREQAEADRIVRDYDKLTDGSHVINGDTIRSKMEGFVASDPHQNRTLQPRSNEIRERIFADWLNTRKGKGETQPNVVLFTMGGAGSGKSRSTEDLAKGVDFTYDSTGANYDDIADKIRRVKENGQQPIVTFVYCDPKVAWERAQGRVEEGGHAVSPGEFADLHINARKNIDRLISEFGRDIIRVVDNSSDTLAEITVEQLSEKPKYTKEQINDFTRDQGSRRLDRVQDEGVSGPGGGEREGEAPQKGDGEAGTDRDQGRADGREAQGEGGGADKGRVVDRTDVPDWLDDEGVDAIFKAKNFSEGWGEAVNAFSRHRYRTDPRLQELKKQFEAETDQKKREKINRQYKKRIEELWNSQGPAQPQDEMIAAINAIQSREGSVARSRGQAPDESGRMMTDAARKRQADVKELTGIDFDEHKISVGDLMKFRKLHENYAKGEKGAADALKKFVEDLQAKEKPIDIPEKPNVAEEAPKAESPAPKAETSAPKKDLNTAVHDLAELRDRRRLLDGTKFTGEDAQANRDANEAEKARLDREIEAAEEEIDSLREPAKPIPPPDKPIKPNPKKAAKIVGDFVATDARRKTLMNPYHDKKNGVVVATNGRFIIATKHGFDPNAKEPEDPFSNWQTVIPKEKDLNASITVNPTELAKVCQKAIRLTRAVGIKPNDVNSTPHVILRNSNGGYSILDANYLLTVAKAMEANGITELRTQDKKGEYGVPRPLMAQNADTTIVIMPLRGGAISSAGRVDGTNVAFDGLTGRIVHAPERTDIGATKEKMMSEEWLASLRESVERGRKEAEFGARNTNLFKLITDAWKHGEKDPNAIYKGFNDKDTFDSLSDENKKIFMDFLNAGSEEELARQMAEYRARMMPDAAANHWVGKDPKQIAKIEKRIAAEDEIESLLMREDEARAMFGMEPRKRQVQAEPPKEEAPKVEKPAEKPKEETPAKPAADAKPAPAEDKRTLRELANESVSMLRDEKFDEEKPVREAFREKLKTATEDELKSLHAEMKKMADKTSGEEKLRYVGIASELNHEINTRFADKGKGKKKVPAADEKPRETMQDVDLGNSLIEAAKNYKWVLGQRLRDVRPYQQAVMRKIAKANEHDLGVIVKAAEAETARKFKWQKSIDGKPIEPNHIRVWREIKEEAERRLAEMSGKPAAEKRLTPETATVDDVTKIMSERWNEVHAKDANFKPSEPKNFTRTAEQLLKNIREKNADGLISTMNGLNPASLRAFEVLTGIKMPRSQRDQHALIDKYCGISPEERAKIEADRKAAHDAKVEADRRAQALAEGEKIMKDTRVRVKSGEVTTAQKLLEDGWTVKRVKRGAASNTHLVAPDGSGYFKIDGKAFEYAEDFIAKRKAEKPAEKGKSFLPGGVIEARYGMETDEGPQPDGWRKLMVGKKGPVIVKVPNNETFRGFVEKLYGKVVGDADVNAGGVEIEGGDIYNVNQILGHMAGATGKVEPMRKGERNTPAKKSRATSAVEDVAKALSAKDMGSGKSAMDKLRKAIAEGEAFPDKETVAELAKGVPAELQKSFTDSMNQWREHAETIANAPAIANAGRNEVIDRMSEGVRPTGFHEADDGVHFEYGDKDVVVKGDTEEVLKWARDRNVFKAEVDAEKKAAADAFNADAFEIGSDGKKKPLAQDNKAAIDALKRLGVTAGLPDADLRRELRRCEAHNSDPRFAQRAEDIKAILEYRKAHENVKPREGGSFAGEVGDDDIREMAVLDIPGQKVAFLDNVADMASVHWNDPESIKQYLLGHIGEKFNSIATGEAIELGAELPDEFSRSNSAEAERRNIKRIAKARTKLATGLGDAIQSAGASVPEPARDKQREGGVYYRRPFTFALRGGDGQIKVYDADLLTYKVNGVEQLYDAVHIRDNTTPGIAGAVEQTVSNVRPSRTTEGSALPSHNAVSAVGSISQTSAEGKPKSDMVVAYEATKVLSNFIPGVKVVVEKDGAKPDSAATPIHSKAGTVVGTWNRKTQTLTLKRGATLETVAHELGGHALWQYAEQHPELGLKSTLEAWAKDAPSELVDAIKKAYPDMTGEKLMEEIFAHRFGREKSGKIAEALKTQEGRKWYQKVWDFIKRVWRSMAARLGGNRIDLNAVGDMTPDETVDFIADQLVRGKTLGKLNMTRPEDVEVVREMRRVNPAPTPLMERSRWTRDWYMRNMADRFHDVLSLERDLAATSGVGIDAKDSAYHALRVSSGRKEAKRREIQLISDRVDKIFNDNRGKITSEDVAKFLLAQAAPDRNAKILRRSGGAKTEGAGISDADAAKIIADLTAAGKMPILQEFEAIRKELTSKYGVDYLADNGIIDRETAERLKAEEPFYVPMRDDYTDENGFDLNSSRRLELPPLKTAHGRSDMADHPLAFLFMQAADNVARVEANIVRQKLARIVQRNAALGVGRVRGQRIVPDYDVATGNTALVVDKLDTERENPNILVFREKGKKKVIEFNGPRGALVVKAVRGEGINRGPEFLQKMSRAWAATATQYSPLGFKTNNAIKDTTEVSMNISEDEGVGTGAKFTALRASAFANGYAATMRDYLKTGNFSGAKGGRLREFVENGGLIGGGVREGYQEIEQRFEDAAKVMSRIDHAKNKPLAMLGALRDKITFSNEMTENLSRFINYDVRRSAGESIEEAIIASREDSTDFNMYGNQRWINNVRVFSNSILGGTMRATRQAAKHPILTATALVALGIIEELADAAINRDDDEREKEGLGTGDDISEYERSQTMRLRVGGKYVRIPFHLGPFSLLKYIGNNAGRAITGKIGWIEAMENVAKEAATVGFHFSGWGEVSFGEDGPSMFNSASPTLTQPVVQLKMNENFMGGQIRKEHNFPGMRDLPDSSFSKPQTGEGWEAFAKLVNEIGGGDEFRKAYFTWLDNAPEDYKYAFEQVFKNTGKDVLQTWDTSKRAVESVTTGENKMVLNDVPVLNKVFRSVPENDSRYYKWLRAYDKAMSEYSNTTDMDRRRKIERDIPAIGCLKELSDNITDMRKQELEAKDEREKESLALQRRKEQAKFIRIMSGKDHSHDADFRRQRIAKAADALTEHEPDQLDAKKKEKLLRALEDIPAKEIESVLIAFGGEQVTVKDENGNEKMRDRWSETTLQDRIDRLLELIKKPKP